MPSAQCPIDPECLLNADGFHKTGGISIPFEHAPNDVNPGQKL